MKHIEKIFNQLTGCECKLQSSNNSDADLQFNGCFELARKAGVKPVEYATGLVDNLQKHGVNCQVSGNGFINIYLSDRDVVTNYEATKTFVPFEYGKIMIDFGGPNIAKGLHVGHLRSFVIGDVIQRMMSLAGYDTWSDIHLGDWGLPIGHVLSSIIRHGLEDHLDKLSLDDMNLLYPDSVERCRNNPEELEHVQDITRRLQAKEEPYMTIWKKVRALSIQAIKTITGLLNIEFDLWLGESDTQELLYGVRKTLMQNDLLVQSDGATIIELEEGPPLIFEKANGAILYGTTDLLTIFQREGMRTIYVTDNRQKAHFKQVFQAAIKTSPYVLKQPIKEGKLRHVGFGAVSGPGGKPLKTRDGNVPRLDTLLLEAMRKVEGVSHMEDARIIAMGCIRFADLASPVTSGYRYDPDKMLSIHGRTGVYVQYAMVRARAIASAFSKEGFFAEGDIIITNKEERALLIVLSKWQETMKKAVHTLEPSLIAGYAYDLAKAFNAFYGTSPINKASGDIMYSRYTILQGFIERMTQVLRVLGIGVPTRL